MTRPDLQALKSYADMWLSPIERVKDELRSDISVIKSEHSDWEHNNDARWSWITGLKKTLQSTQMSLLFMKCHMTDAAWWSSVGAKDFNTSEISEHVKEYEIGVRIALMQLSFSVLEDTLRSITRALYPSEPQKATQNFHNIYHHILGILRLNAFGDLFDCYSLIRNTVHTNGTYYPQRGGDRDFEIDGRKFQFRVGKRVDVTGFEPLLWLLSRLREAMLALVRTPKISQLSVVPRLAS